MARLIITLLVIALLVIAGAIVAARLIRTRLIRTGTIIAARLGAICHIGQVAVDRINHIKGNRIRLLAVIGGVLARIRPIVGTILWAVIVLAILSLIAIALLTAFLFRRHFAHRFGQHTGVMFGMLREIFRGHTIIRPLRIAGKHLIFFDDLLRRATHLALGARAVENTIDDIA